MILEEINIRIMILEEIGIMILEEINIETEIENKYT